MAYGLGRESEGEDGFEKGVIRGGGRRCVDEGAG